MSPFSFPSLTLPYAGVWESRTGLRNRSCTSQSWQVDCHFLSLSSIQCDLIRLSSEGGLPMWIFYEDSCLAFSKLVDVPDLIQKQSWDIFNFPVWSFGFWNFFSPRSQSAFSIRILNAEENACLLKLHFFFWDSLSIPSVKCKFYFKLMMADVCGWTLLRGDTVWLVWNAHEKHRKESNNPTSVLLSVAREQTGHLTRSEALSSQHSQRGNWVPLERTSEGAIRPIPRNEHNSGWC